MCLLQLKHQIPGGMHLNLQWINCEFTYIMDFLSVSEMAIFSSFEVIDYRPLGTPFWR